MGFLLSGSRETSVPYGLSNILFLPCTKGLGKFDLRKCCGEILNFLTQKIYNNNPEVEQLVNCFIGSRNSRCDTDFLNLRHDTEFELPALDFFMPSMADDGKSYLELLSKNMSLDQHTSRKICVITGIPGVGKTTLASAYVHASVKSNIYKIVCWVHAETSEVLIKVYRKILDKMFNINSKDMADKEVIECLNSKLKNHRFLLVFDNVPMGYLVDGETVSSEDFFLANLPTNGNFIITSRKYNWSVINGLIDLRPFSEIEALKYIEDKLNKPNLYNEKAAKLLVQELEGLPLALSFSTAYMNKRNKNIEEFLGTIRSEGAVSSFFSGKNELQKVLTFSITGLNSLQHEILLLCAYLHPEFIPIEIFTCLNGQAYSAANLDDAIIELEAYSFVRKNSEHSMLRMHRLLQSSIKKHFARIPEVVTLIKKYYEVLIERDTAEQAEKLFFLKYHCDYIRNNSESVDLQDTYWEVRLSLANALKGVGRYLEAKKIYDELLLEPVTNKNNKAKLQYDAALCYEVIGDYERTINLNNEVITFFKDSETTCNNLKIAECKISNGNAYTYMFRKEEAEKQFVEALRLIEQFSESIDGIKLKKYALRRQAQLCYIMAINSDEILKAIANLKKCIELWKQIDKEYERKDDYYRDLCSLAIWTAKLGEIKEADVILNKVEGHISRNKVDAIIISRTFIERGHILLRTNKLSAAEIMLTENIKKYEELVGSSAMSDIHLMFIECLIRNNKLSEALEIINLYSDDDHVMLAGARREGHNPPKDFEIMFGVENNPKIDTLVEMKQDSYSPPEE